MQSLFKKLEQNKYNLFSIINILILFTFNSVYIINWFSSLSSDKFIAIHKVNRIFLVDFFKYYSFTKIMASSDSINLYNPIIQKNYFTNLVCHNLPSTIYYAEYPPFVGIIFKPLLLFPVLLSCKIFMIISFIFCIFALFKLVKKFNPSLNFFFFIIGFLATAPVFFNLILGQLFFILTGSLSFFCLAVFF